MVAALAILMSSQTPPKFSPHEMHGYISAQFEKPSPEYGYGVSLYSAAWPLLEKPLAGFQIGLASTWLLPDNSKVTEPLVPVGTVARDSMPERGPSFWTVFQTIEGGLGFWASNRYFAPTCKFRMNGSIDGYNHEVATSGWDFYGNPLPKEYMGIAQLSPCLLVPPDGITLAENTCGEMFGYAWMALPLFAPRNEPVPTGNQTWTMFLNTTNFRGPVAFYIPSIWSKMSQNHPPAVGRGLDVLAGVAGSGAIEVNTVPGFISSQIEGSTYHRIPQLQFPADKDGRTVLMQNMTAYSKDALWNSVEAWMKGGSMPTGQFDLKGAFVSKVTPRTLTLSLGSERRPVDFSDWVKTAALDSYTFGLEWNTERLAPWKNGLQKGLFPAYFRNTGTSTAIISETAVPAAAELKAAQFPAPDTSRSYVPSEGGEGVWKTPGPAAGPFKATLVDGSTVTYYWYKFIDQPAMQGAGLTFEEKQKLQSLVEKIHQEWTKEKQYMSPPRYGRLASLDQAQLVSPPKGMEIGYVPVAIRQDPSP